MKAAALSIVCRNDHVLLVLRTDVPVWVLPGGGIDDNETAEQCAVRETLEETGIHITTKELVGIYHPNSWVSSPIHVFSATPGHFTFPQEPSSESAAVRFFSLESLPKNLFFLHATIIRECLSDTSKPIERILSELTCRNAIKMCIQHPLVSLRYAWTRVCMTLCNFF